MIDYTVYSDRDLLLLLQDSKKKISDGAFREIYSKYSAKLYTYCKIKSYNSKEIDDVFQETWSKFYKVAVDGLETKSIQAYLFRIARNIFINQYHSRKNINEVRLDEIEYMEIADELNLEKQTSDKDLIKIIENAMKKLDDKHRESFFLRWYNNMTYEEIGKTLDENTATVKMRCKRAMNKLMNILKPYIIEINEQ
jgi:RNA polymerase sigma-70 factor (ECF subfamily)